MRQYLFRGKSLEDGSWKYGSLVQKQDGSTAIFYQEDGIIEHDEVDPSTVGQWTGLLSKSGVRIFEGDLVTFSHTTAMDKKFDYTEDVYYEECHFMTKTFYLCAAGIGEFEVVGSVHDSPNLK